MDMKLWGKRVAFVTGSIVLLGLVLDTWNRLGLPVPATAADINQLSKGQAQIGIKVQSQEERRLRSEIRSLSFQLKTLERKNKTDPMVIDLKKIYIRDLEELKIQLDDEKQLRLKYNNRLLDLEKGK